MAAYVTSPNRYLLREKPQSIISAILKYKTAMNMVR